MYAVKNVSGKTRSDYDFVYGRDNAAFDAKVRCGLLKFVCRCNLTYLSYNVLATKTGCEPPACIQMAAQDQISNKDASDSRQTGWSVVKHSPSDYSPQVSNSHVVY